MLELLIVLGLVALLVGGAAVTVLVPWEVALVVGTVVLWLGLIVGLPAGVAYHVALHRRLAPRGELPPRWWLRPHAYHDRLRPDERGRVLRWFGLGAAGFVLILVGSGLAAVGAIRGR